MHTEQLLQFILHPGPGEWIFFLLAVGALPIELSEKLLQGFIILCLFPCGKLPVACLSCPLWTKPFICMTARGQQRSTGAWCWFCQICSQSSSPSCHTACQRGGLVQQRSGGSLGTWPGAHMQDPLCTSCSGIQPCWSLFNTWGHCQQTQVHFLVPTLKPLRLEEQIWLD